MSRPKRVTSNELVEVRTVLSRARTALAQLNRSKPNDYVAWSKNYARHTEHELSMMRSALTRTIEDLTNVELAYGYRSAE